MTLDEAKEIYDLTPRQEKEWMKHFNRALKGFNRMLKDKNIERIVKSENRYCIQYKNGQQFFVSGAVADAANICYEEI
ncbi:MAG TPA: hypothetical protein PKL77_09630 [Candidatus Omnitrophota bacterium]|nr:hypothetical protein [Candidatus Omnitrophota bacterium]